MPEEPKKSFFAAIAKKQADAEAAKVAAENSIWSKQRRRQEQARERQVQREIPEVESEAAQWVRANMEWETHPCLWCFNLTSYSDYSGGFLEKANLESLKKEFPELMELGGGGHGSSWIGIPEDKLASIDEDTLERLKEIAGQLSDYPVLNDDLMSRLEMDAQWEFWAEDGRDEIRKELLDKWSGSPDAQMAVLLKPNAFWDEQFQEQEWYNDVNTEGFDFHLSARSALRDFAEELVIDHQTLLAFKRQMFFEEGAEIFTANLGGIHTNGPEELWQIFLKADQEYDFWEISTRIQRLKPEDEINPKDNVSFNEATLIMAAQELGTPEERSAALRRMWARDPKQLPLPGYESLAKRLVAALLEEESPKAAFLATRKKSDFVTSIHVVGRRWWRRSYGGTYYRADIYVNDQLVHTLPTQGGANEQYMWEAWNWLTNNDYVIQKGSREAPWNWASRTGKTFTHEVHDVRRERDL